MAIPLIDLRRQHAAIRAEVDAAVRRVLESQRFILGAEVETLEASVARLSGCAHAVGCASGSDAIMLAVAAIMHARGLDPSAPFLGAARGRGGGGHRGQGSVPESGASEVPEVVTVPFTFFASAGSVVHAGAAPRFVDIEPEAYGMDPARIRDAITPRTIALLPVHLFGQPCDLEAIARAAGAVPIVEDVAQAIGASFGPRGKEKIAGSIGLLGTLSFFPTKNLGGAGDGGMVLTSDGNLAEILRRIRVHGGRQMYEHRTVGWNSRLDELQAAILSVKLAHLAEWSEARRARAARYDGLLEEAGLVGAGLVRPPARAAGRSHIFHQYVVRVLRSSPTLHRDGLREHLSRAGIATGVYYPVPLHLQECFRGLGYARGDFPVSEQAAEEVLALPIFPELSPDEQALVVREIAAYFGLA